MVLVVRARLFVFRVAEVLGQFFFSSGNFSIHCCSDYRIVYKNYERYLKVVVACSFPHCSITCIRSAWWHGSLDKIENAMIAVALPRNDPRQLLLIVARHPSGSFKAEDAARKHLVFTVWREFAENSLTNNTPELSRMTTAFSNLALMLQVYFW